MMMKDNDGNHVDDTWMETAKPVTMRQYFRKGNHFQKPTCGVSKGHNQANVTMLHKSLAGSFGKFCHANSGPLPLLYQSKVGEFSAPKISHEDSDIRTDLPGYIIFENGQKSDIAKELLVFSDKLNDYVFFYLGCSFSFDEALLEAGVPLRCLEQQCSVSAYKTNTRCQAVGEFDCCQVVSMRPIPRELIEKSFAVTLPMNDVHGAPIHIGNPAAIGIRDISKPEYGDPNRFHDGDIPVFWSCGITGIEAILSAKPELAFTHHPGNMYIADTPSNTERYKTDNNKDATNVPRVITIVEEPCMASVTSESVLGKIRKLEELSMEDPGNRQISALLVPDDLVKSAASLSHSSSVLITIGYPLIQQQTYENDGIAGAVAIATMLQGFGITVSLVVEKGFHGIMKKIAESLVTEGIVKQNIPIVQYPSDNTSASRESAKEFLTLADGVTPKYDHLVALERPGRAAYGKHYTMGGVDISHLTESLDYLFIGAAELPMVFTTGVGNGGNEIGMGKVHDAVVKNIPNGKVIASVTSADYVITSGIIDWGGYALAMALYMLRTCPIHERYQRRAIGFAPTEKQKMEYANCLPSIERERKILELLMRHNILDGMLGCQSMSVDGLSFDGVLDIKIKQMVQIVE